METVIRVVVIYLFVLVGLRLLGKRELGQLAPIELVTLLLIPELASQALVREDYSLTNAILAIATLLSLVFLISMLKHKSTRMEKLISDTAAVLVAHGRMLEDNMNRERVGPDEIVSEMHKVGLERLEQVRWAILESSGEIALIPEPGERVTPGAAIGQHAGPM